MSIDTRNEVIIEKKRDSKTNLLKGVTKNYINVIVASKHERPQWLTMDEAFRHCYEGIGIWKFASNDIGEEPDIVMASCGDAPTLETLAANNFKSPSLFTYNAG